MFIRNRMRLNILLLLLIGFIPVQLVWGTPAFSPGLIPLEYGMRPASDLFLDGKPLLPDEAHKKVVESKGQFDLSLVNPDATSDLWKIQQPNTARPDDSAQVIPVETDTLAKFLAKIPSRSGNFRFSFSTKDPSTGQQKIWTAMVGKKVHNVLLRKNLLKKLGYVIPPIKYLPRMRVQFSSYSEKELFFGQLSEDTFADPSRWVLQYEDHRIADEGKDENNVKSKEDGPLAYSEEIELQDLIVMENVDTMYNLALGFLPASIIEGRRLLNSLIVPFGLVEIPESVNLFSWHAGRIINKQFKVEYDSLEEFSCTYDDARWILRRILQLNRGDFEDIVRGAHFPREVELLVVEKLISRRNHLREVFSLEKGTKEIEFNSKISHGESLQQGKLLQENWPGYSSRFSYGDPESPLSGSEMFAFARSKTFSMLLQNLMAQVNNFLPHADLQGALLKHQEDLFFQQLAEYLQTGVVKKVPLGIWATPLWDVNVFASRDVVTGSYLGTDNRVQLADSLGFNIDAGVYLRVDGLEAPWSVSSTIKGGVTRTYSHLRPINSFKAALKYPYKNILVPLLQRKYGNFFNSLLTNRWADLPEEEKQKELEEVLGKFKEEMQVGESILVTDSLGGGLNIMGGASFAQVLQAQAAFGANQVVISRLHIFRKDEDTIQIYRDLGNITSLILSFQFNAVIPILNLSSKWSRGTAKTQFYSLDLDPQMKRNPKIISNLRALRQLFLNNSLEGVRSLMKPYQLVHKFTESMQQGKLLFMRGTRLAAQTRMEIVHPQGQARHFYRTEDAWRKGVNYEEFTTEAVNALLNTYSDWEVQLNSLTSGHPGDSLKGHSVLLAISFEGEHKSKEEEEWDEDDQDDQEDQEDGDSEVDIANHEEGGYAKSFAQISSTWRGWSISKRQAQRIMNSINKRYGQGKDLFPALALQDTSKIFLYTIGLDVLIYKSALNHLAMLPEREVKAIFSRHGYNGGPIKAFRQWNFIKTWRSFKASWKQGLKIRSSNRIRSLLSQAHRFLSFNGLAKLLGGDQNFLVQSRLDGFRVGDENGDQSLISDSLGEIADREPLGPLQTIRDHMEMTESEFFAYWIRGRIY